MAGREATYAVIRELEVLFVVDELGGGSSLSVFVTHLVKSRRKNLWTTKEHSNLLPNKRQNNVTHLNTATTLKHDLSRH